MVAQIAKKSAEQRMAEMTKKAAAVQNWMLKLAVVKRPPDHALELICDEYVGYVLQPRMRPLSPKIDELTIEIRDPKHEQTEKCEYQVKNRLGLFTLDGSMLPRNGYKFAYMDLAESGKVLFAILTMTRDLFTPKLVTDVLIIVPTPVTDTSKLSKYLTAAAQKFYADVEDNNYVFRFQALTAGSQPGRFRLPGRTVTAYKDGKDQLVLVQSIAYKFSNLQKSDGNMGKMQNFIEILALNQNLSNALATGGGGAEAKQYVSAGIYEDSRAILNAAGVYAADTFDVNRVIVVSKEPFPGRRQGIRIPVVFERSGGAWVAINRRKQN